MGCARFDTSIWTSDACAVPPPHETPLELLELDEELLDEWDEPEELLALELDELDEADERLEVDEELDTSDERFDVDDELENVDERSELAADVAAELVLWPDTELVTDSVWVFEWDALDVPVALTLEEGELESLDPHAEQRVAPTTVARKLRVHKMKSLLATRRKANGCAR